MRMNIQSLIATLGILFFSINSSAQIALGFDLQVSDPARLISAMDEYTARKPGNPSLVPPYYPST